MATSVKDEVKQLNVNKEASYLESFIKSKCRLSEKYPNVYIPRCRTTFADKFGSKKVEVGRKDKSKREKVIMLVGATGSGKTTTINAMLNYIMGVEFEDQFRLQLIEEEDAGDQTKSVTKCITAYTIHYQPGFKTDFTLTIIDTPGFGDIGGITTDKEVMVQIKTFISTEEFGGIDILDAVGFVVPSNPPDLPRLSNTSLILFPYYLVKTLRTTSSCSAPLPVHSRNYLKFWMLLKKPKFHTVATSSSTIKACTPWIWMEMRSNFYICYGISTGRISVISSTNLTR